MTSIPQLIAELQSRGIILFLTDGEIRYRAPKDALTAPDRERLRASRDRITAFLRARDAGKALRAIKGRPGPLTPSIAQDMWWRFGGGPNEGKPVALNINMVTRIQGHAVEAIAAAIRAVVARHDTLRTRIRLRGEELLLSLNPAEDFHVEIEDLRGLNEAAAEEGAQAQLRDYCARLKPVEGDWLTVAKLVALPGGDVWVAISCSHIITDAGSRNIVLDEVRDILEGKPVSASAITYNDFSLAERDFFDGPQGADLVAYWRDWYAAKPILLTPDAKAPMLWGTGTRIVNNFQMPRRVLENVRALAERMRVTPFLVHLTIFSLALARWSRTGDFTIRILGDKRTSLELSHTVGLMFCADAVDIHAPPDGDFETILRGILTEYDASLALRVPTLHYYPPQCVRPDIEGWDAPNKIPAVFNYFAAGTDREKADAHNAPDVTAAMPWPPVMQRMPPATWTRPSAPVFLHLMDMGASADASLHFYADVVSAAEQQAFADMLFGVYDEVAPV